MDSTPLPPDIDEFISAQNEKLVKTSAERSEESFGLGCTLGILPILIMIAVLWIFDVLNLISVLITAALGGIALVAIAGFVAASAKARSLRDTYRLHVKMEIDRYLLDHRLSRSDFDARAWDVLAEGDPLLAYIESPRPQTDQAPEENHAL